MGLSIEELGITKEELIEKVVEKISESTLSEISYDEDGNAETQVSRFHEGIKKLIKARIDTKINEIAEAHVLPKVSSLVENIVLQETTKWGEKVGEPVTFIQYLTKRAESYLQEYVDYQGKSKEEAGYGWSKSHTRITHLVNAHLHYSIKTAMETALKNVNSAIVKGIEETVKIKLEEAQKALKISVALK